MTRVLLAGGGHTHLVAGPALARRAGPGTRIAMLAPSPRLLYSGMMPGWIAGRHRFDDCSIDLARVAHDAGIEWIEDTLVDVDVAAREAVGASGRRHPYDLVSLNVGSENLPGERAPGATPRVLGAKPFAAFVRGWNDWLGAAPSAPRCVVVGGGAAAIEIACALAALCRPAARLAGGSVALATSGDRLLPGMSGIAARQARAALERQAVAVHLGCRYLGVEGDSLRFEGASPTGPIAGGRAVATQASTSGPAPTSAPRSTSTQTQGQTPTRSQAPPRTLATSPRIPADLVIVATGARPPEWLARAARAGGLPVAADGGLVVDACMRSPGDAAVFASGDCASFVGITVPRSGVHALRQGLPLAESIAAVLADPGHRGCAGPQAYRPQRRALALLDLSDGTAIAAWGPLGAHGSALLRWKDRIDRGFVDRFRPPGASPSRPV